MRVQVCVCTSSAVDSLMQPFHDATADWEAGAELEYKGHSQGNAVLLCEWEEGGLGGSEEGVSRSWIIAGAQHLCAPDN